MVRSFRAVNVLKLVTVPDFSSLKFSVFKEPVFWFWSDVLAFPKFRNFGAWMVYGRAAWGW